jgi:hypothetical protein
MTPEQQKEALSLLWALLPLCHIAMWNDAAQRIVTLLDQTDPGWRERER